MCAFRPLMLSRQPCHTYILPFTPSALHLMEGCIICISWKGTCSSFHKVQEPNPATFYSSQDTVATLIALSVTSQFMLQCTAPRHHHPLQFAQVSKSSGGDVSSSATGNTCWLQQCRQEQQEPAAAAGTRAPQERAGRSTTAGNCIKQLPGRSN
jgi:hypothetical protein